MKHVKVTGQHCVTELVIHMATKTRDLYKGTNREDDWYFYHDAFSQMTAKCTVK